MAQHGTGDGMQRAAVVWLTGLSGAGKSSIASCVEHTLHQQGRRVQLLDGDRLRRGTSRDLGFSLADRSEHVRRTGELAKALAEQGTIVLVALISPLRADRDAVRARLAAQPFYEVLVDAPLALAEARDPKGLYRRARAGLLPDFTGIDSPYEAPLHPELRLDTARLTVQQAAAAVLTLLAATG
ncbi:adenylyl-sulfate kinase [Chitiniphilus purpureus]|uniref:Adenylyl-sulfate kinase n=1 Tax=Chitiniphilus purpureus TaxID=2981137 RepID=A0ABY6DS04_9NEIS|nr:adenylyl-sulfate kinase [Chitiniphilus sp. CD1]UXY17155.1 adenylyl-sulfate kinase [Chitiniphilus sp. CD1]